MVDDKMINWEQGDTIYNINDDPEYAYFLEEGEIELITENNVIVGYINSGEIFGEQACLLGTQRTLKTIASKNSRAILIPKKKLLKEYERSPIIIKAILRSTYIRLTNLNSTKNEDLENFNGKK